MYGFSIRFNHKQFAVHKNMKKQVLLFLLDKYADWEAAYVSTFIMALGNNNYSIKTVSIDSKPISSIGGFTVLPDYDLQTMPKTFEALILIGGFSWRTADTSAIAKSVHNAVSSGKVVGGICDAAGFLGTLGLLNNIKHTLNDVQDLKSWAGENYLGDACFLLQPSVIDSNIITANGTAPLEFARDVLMALEIDSVDKINKLYNFHKLGYHNAPMPF